MVCSPRPRALSIYSFRVGSSGQCSDKRRWPCTVHYRVGLEGADRNGLTGGPDAAPGGDDGATGDGGTGDPPVETPNVDDATDAGS